MAHTPTVTYTNNPGGNPVDHVRLLVGDTDVETPGVALLTDGEIQFRLDNTQSEEKAAWRCCQDIISKLTPRSADWGAGAQNQAKSKTLEHYRNLLRDLRTRGGGEFVAMKAGGLSESQKQANEQDDDRVQGQIRSNQFRNPRKGDARETFE